MIRKWRFFGLLSTMTGGVAAVVILTVATGAVYAFPIAGIGGFYVNATSMTGNDMHLYPTVAPTSGKDAYPQGVIELSSGSITELEITKTMNLSEYTDVSAAGTVRVRINASSTNVKGPMLLRASSIEAEQANFSGLAMQESSTSTMKSAPGPFNMTAPNTVVGRSITVHGSNPGIEMQNMSIQAHYLVNEDITLNGMKMQFMYDPDNDGTYEFTL